MIPEPGHNFAPKFRIIICEVSVVNSSFVERDDVDLFWAQFLPLNLCIPDFFSFKKFPSSSNLLFSQTFHFKEIGSGFGIHKATSTGTASSNGVPRDGESSS